MHLRIVPAKQRMTGDKGIRDAGDRQRAPLIDADTPERLVTLLGKLNLHVLQHFRSQRRLHRCPHRIAKEEQRVNADLHLPIERAGDLIEGVTLGRRVGILQYHDLAPGQQR